MAAPATPANTNANSTRTPLVQQQQSSIRRVHPNQDKLNKFIRDRFAAADYASKSNVQKREWRQQLAQVLNEQRFTEEVWTQENLVHKLTNLKLKLKTPRRRSSSAPAPVAAAAAAAAGAPQSPTVPVPVIVPATTATAAAITTTTTSTTALETFFLDYRRYLVAAARLTGSSFHHPADKGTSNEHLLKEFLVAQLPGQLAAVGAGEILGAAGVRRRQRDIVLYNPQLPKLVPPTGSGGGGGTSLSSISLFFAQSVIAVVEVKTTLSNADVQDAAEAAADLPPGVPLYVVGFNSEVQLENTLTPTDCAAMRGIFSFRHGALLQNSGGGAAAWTAWHLHSACPLALLWCLLLEDLRRVHRDARVQHLAWRPLLPDSYSTAVPALAASLVSPASLSPANQAVFASASPPSSPLQPHAPVGSVLSSLAAQDEQ